MIKHEPRWTPSLRQTMAVTLAGMIILTSVILTVSSYYSTRQTMLSLAKQLIDSSAQIVR